MKIRLPICSELSGRRIETVVTIQDLTGASMQIANSFALSLLKMAASVGSSYYPETLGLYLIVNAPAFFPFVWRLVKGFLDEKT